MIGKASTQQSLLDGVFNARKKHSRTDTLLTQIHELVDWNQLTTLCQGIFKDSNRGRPTIPLIVSLKCLILQYLYNLSDPALEDALIDRLSFQRFLGVSFDTELPDFSTIWRFRERLVAAQVYDALFEGILQMLDAKGLLLRRGTLVDASLVRAARKPRKGAPTVTRRQAAQADTDATYTVKGKTPHYGYKGHIGTDYQSNLIRTQCLTTAKVHDSQVIDQLISGDEHAIFGDKAYADDDRKRTWRKHGIYSGILDKGRRNHPLSGKQRHDNQQKNRVRSAVERPFAYLKQIIGYRRVRYVTLPRNALHFAFLCMIYNLRHSITLIKKD